VNCGLNCNIPVVLPLTVLRPLCTDTTLTTAFLPPQYKRTFGRFIITTVDFRCKCLLLYFGHPCAGQCQLQCSCTAVYSANYSKSSLTQLPHVGFKQHLTVRSIPSIAMSVSWSTRHKRTSPLKLRAFHTKWYKGKVKVHPCTGTEALYRPHGP
jgi:hypothetical protein